MVLERRPDTAGRSTAVAPLIIFSSAAGQSDRVTPGPSSAPSSGMPLRVRRRTPRRLQLAVRAGKAAAQLSRRLGQGEGAIIGGRVALALCKDALAQLAADRRVVLVSGTNGKTTTSHLLAAALRTAGPVAHNDSGANMADGAVAALMGARDAPLAVLEVDELHLAGVAAAVRPDVIVLLNLTRDQLDRGTEVRAVAGALQAALAAVPGTTVVGNADDPMVVWAAQSAGSAVWVAAGAGWSADVASCPGCGRPMEFESSSSADANAPRASGSWACGCGLARPSPGWGVDGESARTPTGFVPLPLRLPGRFNTGNAVMALAAADLLGVTPHRAAPALAAVEAVAGRYAIIQHSDRELRLLLAKNPAGFTEALELLEPARSLLITINAREADGRDTSWLWDVPFERLAGHRVIAAGERAADLGVRLSYAGIEHATVTDPLGALELLPPGKVDAVANYTAFHQLLHQVHKGVPR